MAGRIRPPDPGRNPGYAGTRRSAPDHQDCLPDRFEPGCFGECLDQHRPGPHVRGWAAGGKPRATGAQPPKVDSRRRRTSRQQQCDQQVYSEPGLGLRPRRTDGPGWRRLHQAALLSERRRAGSVSPIRRSLPDLPGRMAAGRHLPGGSGPGRESRGSRYHGARANRVAGQVAGRERRARRELFHSRREPDGGLAESAAAPGTETDDRRGAVERRRSLLPDSEYRIHRSRKSTLPGGDPPARLCRHGNLQVVARQRLGGHRR